MKSNIKKMLAGLLAVMMLVSFAACGDEDSRETQQNISTNETEDIMDIVESVAQNNSDVEVDNYVVSSEGDFTWEEVDGGAKVTGYLGTDAAIEIPESLGGLNVVAIGSSAFSGSTITGVKFPDSVVMVDAMAFYYCTTLVEVSMGNAVEVIGDEAFEGCVALKVLKLNDNLKTIGTMAFGMCTSLESVDLPMSLQNIGKGAFGMSGLKSIVIPGSVQSVGEQAFTTCSYLTNVEVEDGVKTIGEEAFQSCVALTKIDLPASLEEIGWDAFVGCSNIVIYAPSGSVAETYAGDFGHSFKSN